MSGNNNSSNQCITFMPSLGQCSRNGECVDGKCICKSGFVSLGDFALTHHADCDIHVNAVIVLYSILCVLACILLFMCFRYIILRYRLMKERTEQKWSDLVNVVVFSCIALCVSLLIFAALRLSNPYNHGVGLSFASTLFLGLSFNFFWLTESLYLYFFASLVIKQSRMKSDTFKERSIAILSTMKNALVVACVVNLVWGFLPIILVYIPSQTAIIAGLHYVGAGVNIFSSVYFIAPRCLKPIRDDIHDALVAKGFDTQTAKQAIAELENASPHNQIMTTGKYKGQNVSRLLAMDKAQRKLTRTLNSAYSVGAQEVILACLFGLWPFLQRKASYQLPSTYSFALLVLISQIHSISNFHSEKKDNRTMQDEDDENEKGTTSSPSIEAYQKQISIKFDEETSGLAPTNEEPEPSA